LWAAAVGLALAYPALGRAQDTLSPTAVTEPARLGVAAAEGPARLTNQQVAEVIAEQLRQSGRLRGFHVDISYAGGVAELTGQVANQGQREEAVRLVQAVPGVQAVRDRLSVTGSASVEQTQAVEPPAPPPVPAAPQAPEVPQPPGPPVPPPPGLMPGKDGLPPVAGGGATPGEPTPIFQAGPPQAGPGPVPSLPPLPPYAWPTYAPYNNYSRVAYPIIYPYQSWPFIGPQYPFPKIPLGWRSVKLTWEDGHWWYARVACGHDWWRLRYW
jgi:hypothetical protein